MLRSMGQAAVVLGAILALSLPVHASPLDDAKAAVEASDYLRARTLVAEALAGGTHGREELAELHRLSGIVHGALGDPKAATLAFRRALALSPKLALPPGTSPKITRPFVAAQDQAKQAAPLEIRAETQASPPSVAIVVVADPMQQIVRLRATAIADGKPERVIERAIERTGGARIELELPAGARIDLRIAALDEHGNRLAEVGSRDVPLVILGKRAPDAPPPRPIAVQRPDPEPAPIVVAPRAARPIYLTWWLYGGVAVALGGATAYFGLDALGAKRELEDLNNHSSEHTFDEATTVEQRGKRSALLANIGLGATGVFAATAAVLFFTEPRGGRGERRAAIAPVPGGGAIVYGGRF